MGVDDRRSAQGAGLHGIAVVGCYTTAQREARGRGIEVYRCAGSEPWERVGGLHGLVNPSFLRSDPETDVVYAAHGDSEFASAYALGPDAAGIIPLGQVRSGGRNGVAVALHPSKKFLFVANYSSGSVATLPVSPDGGLSDATLSLDLPGPRGPHRAEQAMSHPHDVVMDPSGRFLIVPDKGLDRVFVLRPDPTSGELSVASYATTRPGSGPRHVAFHPTLARAYVVNELDSTVTSFAWDAETGTLRPLHVEPALPDSFFEQSAAAEIVIGPSGRHLYVSNRGADTITRFSISPDGERLTVNGWTPTGGSEPRFMTLSPDEGRLMVANQQSDTIVELAIDPTDGDLDVVQVIEHASPSAIAFL